MGREADSLQEFRMKFLACFVQQHSILKYFKKKKKEQIRIAYEDLQVPCCCWLTYRLLFHLCFMCARSAPNLRTMGRQVKAKDGLGQWPAKLVNSLLWQMCVSDGSHSLFQFTGVLHTIANSLSPLRASAGSTAHT